MTPSRRAAAIAAALLGACACFGGLSYAGTTGRATRTKAVTSGTWKAAPSPGTVSFPISLVVPPPPQYLTVSNTGSLTLTGATYTVTRGGVLLGVASVDACVGGTWNEVTNACTGGVITTAVTSATTPASVSASGLYPAAAGASVRFRVSLSVSIAAISTVTISVAVSRTTQVRTPTTTNS